MVRISQVLRDCWNHRSVRYAVLFFLLALSLS